MARPTIYSDALADEICRRIASGVSVRAVGKQEDMPSEDTIYEWIAKKPGFSEKYARAKDRMADSMVYECLEIADDRSLSTSEDVNQARLRVDTRKWAAARMAPRRWGDRQQHEVDIPSGIVFRVARPGELDDAGNVKK